MALKKILIDKDGYELITYLNDAAGCITLAVSGGEDNEITFDFESDEDIDELIDQLTKLKQH